MPFRNSGTARNSEGQEGGQAEGKRARWVAVSLPIEGRTDNGTIAIMDHRQNPEHPAPWRVDGQLGIAPSRCILGEWKLKKGEASTSRYRVFVHTGAIDPARLDASWKEFCK